MMPRHCCTVNGGGKVDHMGGLIVGLRLSTFSGNVRLSVQQECHLSIGGSYQMSMPVGLPTTAASAGFRHRCIALRCLCGGPTLLPSCEWTCPRAWPSAPRPSGPVAEMSASSVTRLPATRPRPHRRWQRRDYLLDPSLCSAVREPLPMVLTRAQGLGVKGGEKTYH